MTDLKKLVEAVRDACWSEYGPSMKAAAITGQSKHDVDAEIADILAAHAAPGQPVAWIKFLVGAECKPNGQCYDVVFTPMNGYQPLYASIEQRAGVPDGWKLVPVEPTDAMKVAAWKANDTFAGEWAHRAYRAMLAAAPKPEHQP